MPEYTLAHRKHSTNASILLVSSHPEWIWGVNNFGLLCWNPLIVNINIFLCSFLLSHIYSRRLYRINLLSFFFNLFFFTMTYFKTFKGSHFASQTVSLIQNFLKFSSMILLKTCSWYLNHSVHSLWVYLRLSLSVPRDDHELAPMGVGEHVKQHRQKGAITFSHCYLCKRS